MGKALPHTEEAAFLSRARRDARLLDRTSAAPGFAGILGVSYLPLLAILKRPATAAIKVTAYGCPLYLGAVLMLETNFCGNLKPPLQSSGPSYQTNELRKQDNRFWMNATRMVSAAGGLILASRRGWSGLSAWQRWIGTASMGAGVGELGQRAFVRFRDCQDSRLSDEGRPAFRIYRASLRKDLVEACGNWLLEKEAQYYRIRDSDTTVGYDAEQAKKQLRAYCETLANEHVSLWLAVSKIDWCIADSQKRIAQHQQFPKGQYQVTSKPSPAASLSFVQSRLQMQVDALESDIRSHTSMIDDLERGVKDPKLPNMPENIRALLNGVSKAEREQTMRALVEDGKRAKQNLVLRKAAVEEVMADSEGKATKGLEEQ